MPDAKFRGAFNKLLEKAEAEGMENVLEGREDWELDNLRKRIEDEMLIYKGDYQDLKEKNYSDDLRVVYITAGRIIERRNRPSPARESEFKEKERAPKKKPFSTTARDLTLIAGLVVGGVYFVPKAFDAIAEATLKPLGEKAASYIADEAENDAPFQLQLNQGIRQDYESYLSGYKKHKWRIVGNRVTIPDFRERSKAVDKDEPLSLEEYKDIIYPKPTVGVLYTQYKIQGGFEGMKK